MNENQQVKHKHFVLFTREEGHGFECWFGSAETAATFLLLIAEAISCGFFAEIEN